MTEIAPVEYMVVSFAGGDRFTGELAPALAELVEAGTIRIIDLAFVTKGADGEVEAFELSELHAEIRDALDSMGIEGSGLLNEDDLADAAAALEPDTSAALLVWENIWAESSLEPFEEPEARLSPPVAYRTTPFSPRVSTCSPRPPRQRRLAMFRRRGPGLMRAAATTAVVAGTAGAVRHHQDQKYAADDQAPADEQAYEQADEQAAPEEPAYLAELEQLADLKAKGVLTEEEFTAKKQQLLGL